MKKKASKVNPDIYPIIGMSPGNSYFKENEIRFLIENIVNRYGRVAILIADIPAISTYMAFGYSEKRARKNKAVPQGNLLRNKVKRAIVQLGLSEKEVKIINWEKEVENNQGYKKQYDSLREFYNKNKKFMNMADKTTFNVLKFSKRDIPDLKKATKIAIHYLLSEISFLEWAPKFLGSKKIAYVYHKNWEIYEDYIAGKFDNKIRDYMDFILLENPWETYNPIWGLEDKEEIKKYNSTLERVNKTGVLRVAFSNYPPALSYDSQFDNFSGIFYEVLIKVARKNKWKVRLNEETGYGVVIEGVNNERFDVFTSPIWPIPKRKENANPSESLYSSEVYPWIRKESKKKNLNLNSGKIRVAIKENDISDYIANKSFSKARRVLVPQLDSILDLLKFVADDKADFTFAEKAIVQVFNESSAIKLIQGSKEPVEIFENTFLFKFGDDSLKDIFNKEIKKMKSDGTIANLIRKYSSKPDLFIL